MKFIELTKGYITCVDDDDYEWLSKYKWCAMVTDGIAYAVSRINGKNVLMHRMILGFPRSMTDHKNGDSLNNQRHNLRPCTHRQNMQNSRKQSKSSNRFKGVKKMAQAGYKNRPWVARIGRETKYLGYFSTEEEAAKAYDIAAIKRYGEFARLNFPQ